MATTKRHETAARATVTGRLRAMEARELPHEIQFRTNVSMHSDGGHMIAGFVCGAGFTLEVAQEVARRCNAHEALLEACEKAERAAWGDYAWVDEMRAAIAKARGTD